MDLPSQRVLCESSPMNSKITCISLLQNGLNSLVVGFKNGSVWTMTSISSDFDHYTVRFEGCWVAL